MTLGLELTCPLVGFDLETTGPFPRVDRIVQVAFVRYEADGSRRQFSSLVKPGVPIPPEATAVHGIRDEDVADKPTFKELAQQLAHDLGGCDYFGYNLEKFDLKVLAREFERAGVQWRGGGRVIDLQTLYRTDVRRRLQDAVAYYLGRPMREGSHDASVDVAETEEALAAAIARHPELPRTVRELDDALHPEDPMKVPGTDGKLFWRYGQPALAFSEHAGVRLVKAPRNFLHWILRKDFTPEVKRLVQEALALRDAVEQQRQQMGGAQ